MSDMKANLEYKLETSDEKLQIAKAEKEQLIKDKSELESNLRDTNRHLKEISAQSENELNQSKLLRKELEIKLEKVEIKAKRLESEAEETRQTADFNESELLKVKASLLSSERTCEELKKAADNQDVNFRMKMKKLRSTLLAAILDLRHELNRLKSMHKLETDGLKKFAIGKIREIEDLCERFRATDRKSYERMLDRELSSLRVELDKQKEQLKDSKNAEIERLKSNFEKDIFERMKKIDEMENQLCLYEQENRKLGEMVEEYEEIIKQANRDEQESSIVKEKLKKEVEDKEKRLEEKERELKTNKVKVAEQDERKMKWIKQIGKLKGVLEKTRANFDNELNSVKKDVQRLRYEHTSLVVKRRDRVVREQAEKFKFGIQLGREDLA